MARIKDGINGGFSGKAGSVIGFSIRGKNYMKGLSKVSRKKPSINQLASRAKFGLIQKWRSYYTDVFAITFKNQTKERSAQNSAHRFNSKIVIGTYPDLKIDPSAIVISQGELPQVNDLTMELTAENQLNFTWTSGYSFGAKPSDLIGIIVSYEKYQFYKAKLSIAHRVDNHCHLQLRYSEGCKNGAVYFTVISNDRESAANSIYMGTVALNVIY